MKFTIADGRTALYQYDTDVLLKINLEGSETCDAVHFAQGTTSLVTEPFEHEEFGLCVRVPNETLSKNSNVTVYFWVKNSYAPEDVTPQESGHTFIKETIRVIPRQKPANYIKTEDGSMSWEQWCRKAERYAELSEEYKDMCARIATEVGEEVEGLPDTIREYVAEHREELRGEAGYTPQKGIDYFDGRDGYTPVKGKDYFDGEKGDKGDAFRYEDFTPTQLESLKGKPGEPGKDYVLTEADKEEIAEKVPAPDPYDDTELREEVGSVKKDLSSVSESITEISEFDETAKNYLKFKNKEISEVITGEVFSNFYLDSGNTIRSIGSSAFKVNKYEVVGGNKYRIIGRYNLAAAYPAVAFSKSGTVSNTAKYDDVILSATSTPTDYNLLYEPNEDGYILIAEYTQSYTRLDLLSVEVKKDRRSIKIQTFGDSITDNTWGDNHTWVNLIDECLPHLDCRVKNNAIGGTQLTHSTAYNGVYDLICGDNSPMDIDNDIIVIMAGTNDWAGVNQYTGDNLGAWGGNYWTIYGCVQRIIEHITTNTDSKLIFCTPPQRYSEVDKTRTTDSKGTPLNYNGKTLREFCDAISEVCKYYGIPCIDLNATLGWNRNNVERFTDDGLHPNNVGDMWIARLICQAIDKYVV